MWEEKKGGKKKKNVSVTTQATISQEPKNWRRKRQVLLAEGKRRPKFC